MVSRSWKEDLPTKEQGRFFGIAGKSSVELRMVAGFGGFGARRARGLNAEPKFAEITPGSEAAISGSSPPRKSVGNPRAHAWGIEELVVAGGIGRLHCGAGECEVESGPGGTGVRQ